MMRTLTRGSHLLYTGASMDGKDLDLIALSFALSRYRVQGDLVDQEGQAISVGDLKTALLSGTPYANDANIDVNINIGSLETESNVTIIEQTVDCDEPSHNETTPTVTEPVVEQEQPMADPVPVQQEDKPQGFGGRLFQYFKGGKNEQQ